LGARNATTQKGDEDNDEYTLWDLDGFPSKTTTTAALTPSGSVTASGRGQPTQKSTHHQEDNDNILSMLNIPVEFVRASTAQTVRMFMFRSAHTTI
jgi:hypothetical protein